MTENRSTEAATAGDQRPAAISVGRCPTLPRLLRRGPRARVPALRPLTVTVTKRCGASVSGA